ncbi:hypothetical protein B0I37DRAFT_80626 [Chaetomium sp. MPI-CAGE-AT-0009]|nr:hypothetical protein B0I37DRAFT_80626 [Chaetomium sp. MPI-CAGE-AT-0009]
MWARAFDKDLLPGIVTLDRMSSTIEEEASWMAASWIAPAKRAQQPRPYDAIRDVFTETPSAWQPSPRVAREEPPPAPPMAADTTGLSCLADPALHPEPPAMQPAKFDTPATDSGYASAFNPLLLSAKPGRADDSLSPPALPWENGGVGGGDDDVRTMHTYSAATTMAQADARHYVSELSSEVAKRLGQQHANLKYVMADRTALSELIKAFGIEIGRESPSQTNLDIMYFVHKYHRQIALQLESLFSYENGEALTNHDDPDKMSLMEKMRLWNNKADSDEGPSLSSDDLFEGIEDDEDEGINHTGFSAHSSVIRKSTALHWLVSGLQKRSSLDWGGEQVPGTVAANGIRRKILEALPSRKISRKRLPQEHQVSFRLLDEDYMSDLPPQKWETRPDAIIITECAGRTQATTIEQYLNQAWPRSGMRIFQLLQEATRNARLSPKSGILATCVSAEAVLPDNNRLRVTVTGFGGIIVMAAGSAHALADYGEQLGWLSAALRPKKVQNPYSHYTPCLVIRQHPEPNRRTYINIHTDYDPRPGVPHFLKGPMGQPEGVVVVCGFPIRRQPEGYCGFETTLPFLLGAGYRKVNLDGRPSLEQDQKDTLTLIRRTDEGVFLWADRRCVSRGCWAADAANWRRNDRDELESARHIILDCRSSCTIEGLPPVPRLGDEVETSGYRSNVGPCDQADSDEPGILDEESKGDHDVDMELPDNASLQAEFQEDLACSTDSDIDSDMLSVSDPSDSASTLDCLSPVMPLLRAAIVRRLVSGYQAVVNGTAPGSGVTASTGPPVSTSSSGTPFMRRKRGRGQSGNDDNEDDDDPSSRRNGKRLKLPSSGKEPQRVLACPLWKADPSKHRRCFAFDLRRIRDVKQHLKRVHRPEHYCRRCSTIFKNRESLAQHVYNPAGLSCPISTQLDGISDDQQEQISKKSKRNLSEEQQWFVIWEILFPGRPRPTSAYREAGISEDLCSFREYCRAYGDTLLDEELETLTPTAGDALPGFQGLATEERCSILRWAFREAVELAFGDWISDRPLDGRRRGDEAGPALTASATPAGCSLADSGVASMTTTQLSVSHHSLDALPSEGNTSVVGDLMSGQAGFTRESRGSPPELEPWPVREDVPGFEPLPVGNYDEDFSNMLYFPDRSGLEF